MERYTIVRNGETYELPAYTIGIAEKLEEAEAFKAKSKSVKAKFKKMYDVSAELLGRETAESIMGRFEETDPNVINFVYLDIVKAYNKPLEEYNEEENRAKMNVQSTVQLMKLLEQAGNVQALVGMKK